MNVRSPWTALVLAVAVAGAVFGIDRFAPEPAEAPDALVAPSRSAPAAGSSVCAVGDDREGTSLEMIVARPGTTGSGPASVELEALREGELTSTSLPEVFPPSHLREAMDLGGTDEAATWSRWGGAPVAVAREWRWSGEADLPPATVAGPCARPFGSQWVIPGMTTVGGNEARLRLANPFRTDATIAIHFVTPEGIREPIALQNWTVPARTVREINVNEVLPELDDLSAVVEVATGRLSVEGYQIARAAIGGVDGGSLLAASASPAENWTVPWVADGDGASSWLWIVNTGDRTAPVELSLHTPEGGDVPDGLAELAVPPGELRRVDLTDTLPEGVGEAAVTVRSDGAPVVVSAATRQESQADEPEEPELPDPDDLEDPDPGDPEDPDVGDPEDPDVDAPDVDDPDVGDPDAVVSDAAEETGLAVQLGVPELDRSWTVSGGASAGREERLRLVNPSGNAATVDVALFHGTTLLEPEEMQDIEVPAGSASSVEVAGHLGDVDAWTAFVVASDGEVAVGRVGSGGDDALRLVAMPGTPGSEVIPDGELLAGAEVQGLVHRMGTSLGLLRADPFDIPTAPDEEAPVAPDLGDVPDPEGIEPEAPTLEDPDLDPDLDPDDPDADDPDADDLDEAPDPEDGA